MNPDSKLDELIQRHEDSLKRISDLKAGAKRLSWGAWLSQHWRANSNNIVNVLFAGAIVVLSGRLLLDRQAHEGEAKQLREQSKQLQEENERLQTRISMLTTQIYEVSQDLDSRGRRLAPFAQRIRDIIRSGLDCSENGIAESESGAGKAARPPADERKRGENSNFMV
ncbi:unnamed protein product [Ostreobium quekettii]|uniref:Uncharacterized protein n=1 Tax=Ostreobium quekettii TaxID=121088 RepID=A0A8S1IPA0_9CHLO|nr:unnamed protein product [Ostreobium quekettii]|eukprot:evm.model.scf_2435EXC.3 EVM.evm.TU.scf_2435EXC.3   scf_2435EXC:20457-22124(-)